MPAEREDEDRGFKVEDKRRFTAKGEPRPGEGAERETAEETTAVARDKPAETDLAAGAASSKGHQGAATAGEGEAGRDELTFSSFVIGLASQAFVFLGAVPDPQSGVVRKDLPQAKAMIDILSMLAKKTAGNLDEHEARMMEEMLYELRMHYVDELRGGVSKGGQG